MKAINKSMFVKDISTLIQLINKFDISNCIEINTLSNLEGVMQYQDDFEVSIENLVFTVDKKISGTIPHNTEFLQIYCTHKCQFNEDTDISLSDPIIDYELQIDINGFSEEKKEHKFSWHLDKHIEEEEDNKPKFTHPCYHFQAAGNSIENIDSGDLVLLSAPRIPHPPMDLFLTFHFVVNNFFSSKDYSFVGELLNDYDYQEIIKRAQNRVWEPYFKGYSMGSEHNDFNIQNIFPLYII
jgi:hypothetical protein